MTTLRYWNSKISLATILYNEPWEQNKETDLPANHLSRHRYHLNWQNFSAIQKQPEEYNAIQRQMEILTTDITAREEELSTLVDQRTRSKSPTLNAILDTKIEEYAGIIDSLVARKGKLSEESLSEPLTDAFIAEMVGEIEALRHVFEALHHINETVDFSAKRKLIDLLNFKVQLRIDEEGQKWVDITWASKKHERKLCVEKTPSLKDSAVHTSCARVTIACAGSRPTTSICIKPIRLTPRRRSRRRWRQ